MQDAHAATHRTCSSHQPQSHLPRRTARSKDTHNQEKHVADDTLGLWRSVSLTSHNNTCDKSIRLTSGSLPFDVSSESSEMRCQHGVDEYPSSRLYRKTSSRPHPQSFIPEHDCLILRPVGIGQFPGNSRPLLRRTSIYRGIPQRYGTTRLGHEPKSSDLTCSHLCIRIPEQSDAGQGPRLKVWICSLFHHILFSFSSSCSRDGFPVQNRGQTRPRWKRAELSL